MLLSTSVATRLEPPRGRAAKRRGRGGGTTCPHAAWPTPASAAISIRTAPWPRRALPRGRRHVSGLAEDAVQRPEPAHAVGTAALFVDAPHGPSAAVDGVVWAVLIDPGTKTGRAEFEGHSGDCLDRVSLSHPIFFMHGEHLSVNPKSYRFDYGLSALPLWGSTNGVAGEHNPRG